MNLLSCPPMEQSGSQSRVTALPMLVADDWTDFALLDSGEGEKLEQWGPFTLRRPDGQVVWPRRASGDAWDRADAEYERSARGGGEWRIRRGELKKGFMIGWNDLRFRLELTPFKHTGLFPEQSVNWRWLQRQVGRFPAARVLNLFAYTGAASLVSAAAGAGETVHVDAAKRIVGWARRNLEESRLTERRVRFLVDDAVKFAEREKRRGRCYQGILLDPPVYGRGPGGELWQIEKQLSALLAVVVDLLDPEHGFLLINCYTTGLSPVSLGNLADALLPSPATIEVGEIGLPHRDDGRILPAGIIARAAW